MFKFDVSKLEWTREPDSFSISEDKIEIVTKMVTLSVSNRIFLRGNCSPAVTYYNFPAMTLTLQLILICASR